MVHDGYICMYINKEVYIYIYMCIYLGSGSGDDGVDFPVSARLSLVDRRRTMQIFIKTLTGRKTNFNFELD